ncbi:MAG: methylenetetrahydrofolate reductase C-terminal domain-containing protein [Armatimonadota bacterium]
MSKLTEKVAAFTEKHPTLYKCVLLAENAIKKPVFKCQDCGQCVLSHNGFTCPMRCPKQIRNGPCGGTRENGHCEVYPERYCIWWLINERSKKLGWQGKLRKYHVPVDRRFEHTSAWMNMFAGKIEKISLKKELDDEKPEKQPQTK